MQYWAAFKRYGKTWLMERASLALSSQNPIKMNKKH